MNDKKLVIIPTYNEGNNIKQLVDEILQLPLDYDILVIDDNSPDGTAEIVRKYSENNKKIYIIVRQSKMGLGTAYLEGFKWAVKNNYEYVFTMDADFSHKPEYLPVINNLLKKNDLVIASRYVENGGIEGWPFRRRMLSRLGNIYARRISGLKVKDCTSGFMGAKSKVIENIIDENTNSDGYGFLVEMKHIALEKGFDIEEFPIIFKDRIAGKSKISRKIIKEAFILMWKLRMKNNKPKLRGNNLFKIIDYYIGVPLVYLLGVFTGKKQIEKYDFKSIVIIKLSAMGDTVLLFPAIRNLKKKFPEAKITAVGTKINSEIFLSCPYIDEYINLDINRFILNPFKFIKLLRGTKYDISIDFDQWLRLTPIISFLTNAKIRLGFKTEKQKRHYAYTKYFEHKKDVHEIDSFLEIVGSLGADIENKKLEFPVSDEYKKKAIDILKSIGIEKGDSLIIFHPETPLHGSQRHWPVEKYIGLGKKLNATHGCKILVTGTKNEVISNLRIVKSMFPFAYLLPQGNLKELASVISMAKLIVCGNTGVMHLACAVGISVVALHGPTNPLKWGPLGSNCQVVNAKTDCSPCLYLGFEYGCQNNTCMDSISVEVVENAIREIFAHLVEK